MEVGYAGTQGVNLERIDDASVLDGKADDRLLDTYQPERRPHVSDVIDLSMYLGKVICIPDPVQAAERDEAFFSGKAPPPPPHVLGPRFRERGAYSAGRLFVRRYSLPGPSLARVRLRKLRETGLKFRTTGVLMDGVGPS